MLVVMGCTPEAGSDTTYQTAGFYETERLYDWAFSTFKVKTLLERGKSFEEIELDLCWGKDFLRLMSADNFTALIPDAFDMSDVEYRLILPSHVDAPVNKGDLIGEVQLVLADEVIGRVGVVSAETVEASRVLILVDKLAELTRTFWFKFIVVFLLFLIIAYAMLTIVKNRGRRRYGRR